MIPYGNRCKKVSDWYLIKRKYTDDIQGEKKEHLNSLFDFGIVGSHSDNKYYSRWQEAPYNHGSVYNMFYQKDMAL